MRILYGLSGDGYGHSSRAKVVGAYLKKWGHDLKFVTYGRSVDVLKDADFDVFEVSGMEMKFIRGKLQKGKTFAYNAKVLSDNLFQWHRFHKLMKEFKPDICISDMDIIVPILRFWYNKPLICIDNQHRITNLKLDVPKKYYKDYLLAKVVVNNFVARAEHFIITSFTEAEIKTKNTTIVPPVIRDEVKSLKPSYGSKIMVYLTRENQKVIDILKGFDEDFVIYGYNVNKKDNNLEFKKKDTFLDDLKNCKAVIATAGFTLMSEALYLKKAYLALPLEGQFEQVLNSLFLKNAGYGDYSDDPEKEDVAKFLNNLESYNKQLKDYKLDFDKLPEILKTVIDRL
ncbi:MAG: MJ1255/VC2487 family glycosyltransferase [Nanoarchaeota archaeon]|nr:MJ1255/VC2487 family glycosyltransferase [Nanoarchaeota archaeon]